jgi:rhodanese-related sulfurtransferase
METNLPVMAEPIEITASTAADMLAATDAELIDVRRQDEWDAGHIDNARHVPLEEVSAAAPSIDRARPVIFYCHVGARSLMAAEAFRAGGYDAYSMAGGIEAWSEAGLPVEGAAQ